MFCSCVMTEETMHAEKINVKFQNDDFEKIDVHIEHGEVKDVNDCIKQITFYEARGGKTFLFGFFEINNKSPADMNLVTLTFSDGKQYATSCNKLKEYPFEMVNGSKVYLFDNT